MRGRKRRPKSGGRRRSCEGKQPYPTRASADAARQRFIDLGSASTSIEVYPCRFDSAHGYHLGHPPKGRKRKQW